jgi:hypothetical protein
MLSGVGMFIWVIGKCEGGNVIQIADLAEQANLTHVLIKVADGPWDYNQALAGTLVSVLRSRSIEPIGWQYVYGANPIAEADKAISRCKEMDIQTFIVNAEAEYKQSGKATAAIAYMDRLRQGLPDVIFGLSSYRYPRYHTQFPWREFRERIDFDMPQVYWMQATNAGAQLKASFQEFLAMTPRRPYFPTGAAFAEWGWEAKPAEIIDFMNTAKELGLAGANFWSWQHARHQLPHLWPVIRDYAWSVTPEPDPEPDQQPQDRFVDLPEKGKSMKLLPDYLDEPIVGENVMQPWETATGRGMKSITLNNLPPGAKGVLVRLAARGTVAGAWVALGSKAHGPARFRIDAHVPQAGDITQSLGPHDIDVTMCPLDANKLYLSWDATDGQVRYYAEIHGYGYEPKTQELPIGLQEEIELLKLKVAKLESQASQIESAVAVLDGNVVKKNTSYKII